MPIKRNRKTAPKDSFWITNLTRRNVSLTDLNLTVPAYSSINLLDSRHYSFSKQNCIDSATSGSIFIKRSMIIVREKPPIGVAQTQILFDRNATIPSRRRSTIEIENIKYEELDITDDKYAQEIVEMEVNSDSSNNIGKLPINKNNSR